MLTSDLHRNTRSASQLRLPSAQLRGPDERESLHARIASLVELLEMKMMIARTPGLSHVAH